MTSVSPSSLTAFMTCPRQYLFRTQMSLKEMPPWITNGLDAHALLEGREVAHATDTATKYAAKLKKMERDSGILVMRREMRHKILLPGGVQMSRVIDLVGTINGEPILADYKTTSKMWEVIPGSGGMVSPKALSFQSFSYLLPIKPEDDIENPFGDGVWPKKIVFLIATKQSTQQFVVEWSEEGERNLLAAVEMMVTAIENKNFPAVRGDQCKNCFYRDACYKTPGWKDLYTWR
jgi:CRISPR/Cas system-associated exonuclease Cas4 (RecB family)